MNNKENKSSSNLIKSIYKSYIDLKTGDLHDLDYDILLENIKSLYLDVKAMRVHPFDLLENTTTDPQSSNNLGIQSTAVSSIDKIELKDDKELEKIEENSIPEIDNSNVEEPSIQALGDELVDSESSQSSESDTIDELNTPLKSVEITEENALISSNEPIETIETDNVEEVEDFNEEMSKTDSIEQENNTVENQSILMESEEVIEDNELADKTLEDENKDDNKIDDHLPITEENFNEDLRQESNTEEPSDKTSEEKDSDDLLEFELNEKSIKEKNSNNIVSFLKQDTINNYQPVGDLIDMIDINTRIGLVEIFFKGDSLSLSESLSVLNKSEDRNKSIQIIDKLAEKYDISQEDDIYGTFINLIDRKFGINS